MAVHEETLLPYRPPFETALFVALMFLPIVTYMVSSALRPSFFTLVSAVFPFALQIFLHRPKSVVRLGEDGLSVRRFGRERFVPWKEFEGFLKTKRGILAKTRTGNVHLGRPRPGNLVDSGDYALLERLEDKAAERCVEREEPRVLPILEGHNEKLWPDILERAAQGDFRTSGITQTHLLEDLLNPDTPPAVRELLAKTLQIRVEQDEVEDALKVFASSRSKRALHRLLAD